MAEIGRKSLGPFVAKMAECDMAEQIYLSLFLPPSPVIISASVIKQKKEEKSRSFDFYDAPQEMALEPGEKRAHTKGESQPPLQEPDPKQGYFWSFHQDPQRAGRYRTNDGRYTQARK